MSTTELPPRSKSASPTSRSEQLLQRAKKSIAGGDNSTMRVLPYHVPLVATRGEGCRVWDADDREYLDLNMAYGPLLLGHRPSKVLDAVSYQIYKSGSQLGFPTEISIRVAEKLKRLFPAMELVRFSSTGTEAAAHALRLARAHTGKPKIIAFEGHYHGWSDTAFHRYHAQLSELPAEGFGPALPGTLGMNGGPHDVIVCGWNDVDLLSRCLEKHRGQVAAVVMEPIAGNCGVIPPLPDYHSQARQLAHAHGALLIFDEVITGMRVAAGGAQELYGVRPDITIVSKALGGGFPVSAFGARAEIMNGIAQGKLFHGGVYSGNAAVLAACEAVLDEVLDNGPSMYAHLAEMSRRLAGGLSDVLSRHGAPHVVQSVGAMLSPLLTHQPVGPMVNYRQVRGQGDFDTYIRWQHAAQERGLYFHPNMFEPLYLSTAHQADDIDRALEIFEDAAQCIWPR